MKVNIYSDHIAYTLENTESIYMAGMKYIRKTHKNLIPVVETTYNGSVRLLYGTDDLVGLREVIDKIQTDELIGAIKEYVKSVLTIDQNDFLDVHAIDVNYTRLYYDSKNTRIRYTLLPVNKEVDYHDRTPWDKTFRNTLLIILNVIFKDRPANYSEIYYQILNNSKTRNEIIELVLNYDYDKTSENVSVQQPVAAKQQQTAIAKTLILEHKGALGYIVFEVKKNGFVLGSGEEADGDLSMDRSISRRHCGIFFNGETFSVEDLVSTNGTKLNGYELESGKRYTINNGDRLTLAGITFKAYIK